MQSNSLSLQFLRYMIMLVRQRVHGSHRSASAMSSSSRSVIPLLARLRSFSTATSRRATSSNLSLDNAEPFTLAPFVAQAQASRMSVIVEALRERAPRGIPPEPEDESKRKQAVWRDTAPVDPSQAHALEFHGSGVSKEKRLSNFAAVIRNMQSGRTVAALGGRTEVTVNQAQYRALIEGLKVAHDLRLKRLFVTGHSKTIIDQMTGNARPTTLQDSYNEAYDLLTLIKDHQVELVHPDDNISAAKVLEVVNAACEGGFSTPDFFELQREKRKRWGTILVRNNLDASTHIIDVDAYAQLAGKLIDVLRPNPSNPNARAKSPEEERAIAEAKAAAKAALPEGGSGRVCALVAGPPFSEQVDPAKSYQLEFHGAEAGLGDAYQAGYGAVIRCVQSGVSVMALAGIANGNSVHASYCGLSEGLKAAQQLGVRQLVVVSSNGAIVKALDGRLRPAKVLDLYEEVRELLTAFPGWSLQCVNRCDIAAADLLTELAHEARLPGSVEALCTRRAAKHRKQLIAFRGAGMYNGDEDTARRLSVPEPMYLEVATRLHGKLHREAAPAAASLVPRAPVTEAAAATAAAKAVAKARAKAQGTAAPSPSPHPASDPQPEVSPVRAKMTAAIQGSVKTRNKSDTSSSPKQGASKEQDVEEIWAD